MDSGGVTKQNQTSHTMAGMKTKWGVCLNWKRAMLILHGRKRCKNFNLYKKKPHKGALNYQLESLNITSGDDLSGF